MLPDPVPWLQDATASLGPWTYVIVAAVVLLETSVGLGLLSPGEAVLAVAGAAAAKGSLDLALLLAVVLVFGLAGDSLSYALGRRFGARFVEGIGRRVGITRARIVRVEELYARRGGWVLIAGRFVGPVRVLAPFVAGGSGMAYARFLRWDVPGIALWGSTYVVAGYAFANALEKATGTIAIGGAVLFVVAIVVYASFTAKSRDRHEKGAGAAKTPPG